MRDALTALGVTRFALGTPYPAAIHALAPPFFAAQGYDLSGDATLDILAMRDVPEVTPERLSAFERSIPHGGAQAVVLLATDLPSFGSIEKPWMCTARGYKAPESNPSGGAPPVAIGATPLDFPAAPVED